MERDYRGPIKMEYASPDGTRPNSDLRNRTIKNFGVRPNREQLEKMRKDFN